MFDGWTKDQMKYMSLGGNGRARAFFRYAVSRLASRLTRRLGLEKPHNRCVPMSVMNT